MYKIKSDQNNSSDYVLINRYWRKDKENENIL